MGVVGKGERRTAAVGCIEIAAAATPDRSDMADQIADMLSRIRNAASKRRVRVDVPESKLKTDIARILQSEGYIRGFKRVELSNPHGSQPLQTLRIYLKYGPRGERVLCGLERVSRPGRRVYYARDKAPPVLAGLGTSILTTSRGVMTERDAAKAGVGGEVLCNVW